MVYNRFERSSDYNRLLLKIQLFQLDRMREMVMSMVRRQHDLTRQSGSSVRFPREAICMEGIIVVDQGGAEGLLPFTERRMKVFLYRCPANALPECKADQTCQEQRHRGRLWYGFGVQWRDGLRWWYIFSHETVIAASYRKVHRKFRL